MGISIRLGNDLNVAGGNIVIVDGCSDSNVGGGVNNSCVGSANGLYVVGASKADWRVGIDGGGITGTGGIVLRQYAELLGL